MRPIYPVGTAVPYLVAIDPGLRHAGVAVFESGVLVGAECVRARERDLHSDDPLVLNAHVAGYVVRFVREFVRAGSAVEVVAEWPRVFGRGRSKGDPNDLLPLAGCSAACVARIQPERVRCVRPDEWKGTMPTDTVVAGRVSTRLNADETHVYGRAIHTAGKTLGHNVTDAVGIGLHRLARFEPVRVIPR